MRHIETGAISPNKLYPDYKLPAATSDRHFLCLRAFELSSVRRNPLQAVISQDKVGPGLSWHSRCLLRRSSQSSATNRLNYGATLQFLLQFKPQVIDLSLIHI